MLDQWIRAFAFKVWQLGLFGAVRFTGAYLFRRLALCRDHRLSSAIAPAKRDVLKHYSMVTRAKPDTGESSSAYQHGVINWVIPPFSLGSGGHLNIFRMISMLETHGYLHRIYIIGDNSFSNNQEARQLIIDHFVPLQAEVIIGAEHMAPAEFVIATSWSTAYWVQYFPACKHRLYFVQDFEPFFYPHGSEYAFAEATYRMGLIGITAGYWLEEKLRREYGMMTAGFGFSYDKSRYRRLPRDGGPRRVFFYARHVTPRRGFELGILALELLHQRLPDVEFVLAGWDTTEFHIPFPHLNAGVVALDELPALYSQCDAALVISFTNLSLLPLELMACGCPVVSNRGPNTEWLLRDGENALLCDPTPQDVAATLERLLSDEELRQDLIQRGLDFAQGTDWTTEGQRVAGYLEHLRQNGTLGS